MKITKGKYYNVVTPDNGLYLYNGEIYTVLACIKFSENPEDNWREITEEEKNELFPEEEEIINDNL